MVVLRLWGPGAPYGDDLYEACDRRGILVWSELYHTWGMYPDSPEFIARCAAEATAHVRRYKHHPSVFMWCGANEVHMGVDVMRPGERVLGGELYHEVYRGICARLDPQRYYHPDCPSGGAFPNDPLAGDTHGYTHFWFVRGCDYPVMITENARWSPPQMPTLRRYIADPEGLWPPGFTSRIRHRRAPASGPGAPPATAKAAGQGNDGAIFGRDIHDDGFLPPAWQLLGKDGNVNNRRAGPVGDFYDTGDTAEGLIYRLGSAHGEFLRRDIERFRRGKPAHQAHLARRTMGHLWWRFNGAWPLIESELVDYLLEPKMAYYAAARAQAPLLLSFEFDHHIYLWLTNDTGGEVAGTVVFQMLDMASPRPVRETVRRVTVAPGDSAIVLPLDGYGMFKRNLVLYARLLGDDGRVLARTTDFADIERNLVFPDTALGLDRIGPHRFAVTADQFARSVHLSFVADDAAAVTAAAADPLMPAFAAGGPAPYFSDNYFDLARGETRTIELLGEHRGGTVAARPFWSSRTSRVALGGRDPGPRIP